VRGSVNSSTALELEQELKQAMQSGKHCLILDFTGMSYISSSGLRVLLAAAKEVGRNDGSLQLCGLNVQVSRLIQAIIALIEEDNKPVCIYLTHCHVDHCFQALAGPV